MNLKMVKNYIMSMIYNFFHLKFKSFFYSIIRFIIFIGRIIKYQILNKEKCNLCKDNMHVYFLRSESTVEMGFDKIQLYDWLICQNEYCDHRIKIED